MRWIIVSLVGIVLTGAGLVIGGVIPLPGTAKTAGPDADAHEPAKSQAEAAKPAPKLAEQKSASVPVTVEKVDTFSIQRTVQVVGGFEGQDDVGVTPKVQGRVVRLHHDVDDVVRPGDVLFEIEAVDYQLAVDEARKSAEAELAKLGLTTLPDGPFDVEQLPSVVRAANVAENFRRRLDRSERLRKQQINTQEDLDQIATDLKVADANHKQAVLDAQGTLATARHKLSVLATAEQRLRDTRVEVPLPTKATLDDPARVEYAVAERMISEGEMVRGSQGSPSFRLVIDKQLKLLAAVPERYVGLVKLGQEAQLGVEAYRDRHFSGRITRVSPVIERTSRTFQIEARIANTERLLKPGGFAKVSILTHVDPKALCVPVESLVKFAGTTKVFVVRGEEARAVVVEEETGAAGRGWVEVRGPIEPGNMVVTSGHSRVVDGSKVTVRKADKSSSQRTAQQEEVKDSR